VISEITGFRHFIVMTVMGLCFMMSCSMVSFIRMTIVAMFCMGVRMLGMLSMIPSAS